MRSWRVMNFVLSPNRRILSAENKACLILPTDGGRVDPPEEGAIPIISDVEGFRAYYVVYAPDDTVTAISVFNDYGGAEKDQTGERWRGSSKILRWASYSDCWAGDRAYLGIVMDPQFP